MGILDAIDRWIDNRKQRKELEAAWRQDFPSFVNRSRPEAPVAPKHPKAALYRHVWRRAVILERLASQEGDQASAARYAYFQELASGYYNEVAPVNAYGKVRLDLTADQARKLADRELAKLRPPESAKKGLPFACIYLGIDNRSHKPYIGQTVGDPESRWKQHRTEGTGPFKSGASFANWEILKECKPSELNYWESYYIGYYDANGRGHNDTKGNSAQAYERGLKERGRR